MNKRHQRRSRGQWADIIARQASSGLTIADYCEANDIGFASFAKWKRRLRSEACKNTDPKQSAKDFVPVQVVKPTDASVVTVTLGANITLTINTSGALT